MSTRLAGVVAFLIVWLLAAIWFGVAFLLSELNSSPWWVDGITYGLGAAVILKIRERSRKK